MRGKGDWGRRPSEGRDIGRKTRSRPIVAAKVPGEAGQGRRRGGVDEGGMGLWEKGRF